MRKKKLLEWTTPFYARGIVSPFLAARRERLDWGHTHTQNMSARPQPSSDKQALVPGIFGRGTMRRAEIRLAGALHNVTISTQQELDVASFFLSFLVCCQTDGQKSTERHAPTHIFPPFLRSPFSPCLLPHLLSSTHHHPHEINSAQPSHS